MVGKGRRELLSTKYNGTSSANIFYGDANLVLTSAQTFLSGQVKIRIFPGEAPWRRMTAIERMDTHSAARIGADPVARVQARALEE
jgi:hypothetical protein